MCFNIFLIYTVFNCIFNCDSVYIMGECVLQPCRDKGGELISLSKKAVDKIILCSEIKKDKVKENISYDASPKVHSKCRQSYILRPKPPKQDAVPPAKISRQ